MENKATTWVIDPSHTEIMFKAKHLVISTITGKFEKFEGKTTSVSADFSDFKAEFTANIDSLSTGTPDRDAHLKSPDFFDAPNYPKLNFVSTGLKKNSDSELIMSGDLTIRGTTKNIDLKVEPTGIMVDPYGNTRAGFEINGKISRKEFGLLWNVVTETGGIMVSDEIKMLVNVEVIKQ